MVLSPVTFIYIAQNHQSSLSQRTLQSLQHTRPLFGIRRNSPEPQAGKNNREKGMQ